MSLHDGFAYRISAAYVSYRLHARGVAAGSDKRYLSNKIRVVQEIEGVAFYLVLLTTTKLYGGTFHNTGTLIHPQNYLRCHSMFVFCMLV